MRLIVITGMPGAGKSVAVQLAREMDLPVFTMGDRVRATVNERGLRMEPEVVGRIASEERKLYGPDIWARRTIEVIPPGTAAAVIDGARSAAEVESFRALSGGQMVVLAIHSSRRTRAGRLRERKRDDDDLSDAGFDERDGRELGWGIGQAIARADLMIINEGPLSQFRSEIRRVLKSLAAGEHVSRPRKRSPARRARRPRGPRGRGKASTKRSPARSRGRTRRSPGRRRAPRRSRL